MQVVEAATDKKNNDAGTAAPLARSLCSSTRTAITAAVLEELIPKNDAGQMKWLAAESGSARALYDDPAFNDEKLIDLCRMVALGLTEQSAAKAIGISVKTLQRWKANIAGVAEEISRAKHLATGAVTAILRHLMTSENDAVALRAVEFFLTRRSKEFREKQDIEIEFDMARLQKKIRDEIYGRMDDEKPGANNTLSVPSPPSSPSASGQLKLAENAS
jgi:transcriptional regulator with XRE-family HTH domain